MIAPGKGPGAGVALQLTQKLAVRLKKIGYEWVASPRIAGAQEF